MLTDDASLENLPPSLNLARILISCFKKHDRSKFLKNRKKTYHIR